MVLSIGKTSESNIRPRMSRKEGIIRIKGVSYLFFSTIGESSFNKVFYEITFFKCGCRNTAKYGSRLRNNIVRSLFLN